MRLVASAFGRNVALGALFLCLPAPAAAQGSRVFSGTGVRNFGTWLDDATVQEPGAGYVSAGLGIYKTPVYREVDAPSIDSGVGVTRRLQVGMSVPYYYAAMPGESAGHGFGDVYLTAKYQLREATAAHAGFAVIPIVEVLRSAPAADGSRVQWALPVSTERAFSRGRAMASTGYFSRGAVFGSGGLEIELSRRAWATGALAWSYSTHHDDVSAALGLHKSHADATGGLTWAVRSAIAVYGTLGRTISAHDDNSASFIFSAGVSFGLKRPVP
jgi:hypothetical protein